MKKMSINRKERGVALLFALGVLALLLIVAIGFMTNSLINRRVADNNASISQTNALAKTARNRIEASLKLFSVYQDEIKAASPNTDILEWSSFNSKLNSDKDRDRIDELFASGSSENSDVDFIANYRNENRPCWIYLYSGTQGDTDDPRRIVGRYAFASALTSPRFDIDNCYLSDGAPNGRVGANASEMVTRQIGETDLIGINFPKILTSSDLKWDNYKAMTDASGNAYNAGNIKTLRKYLILKTSDSPEAYRVSEDPDKLAKNEEYYHRFNLTRTDWNSLSVDDLLGSSVAYYGADSETGENTQVTADTGKALPFIKLISNDKATFADIATRRRQIAANLLDYNKTSDQEVTSDVAPTSWETTAPSYTGNKKTPYLDSLAFAGKFIVENLSGPDSIRTSNPKISFQAGWIANIVSIYERNPDKETKIKLKFKDNTAFSVTLNKVLFKIGYEYEIADSEGGMITVSRNVDKLFDGLNLVKSFSANVDIEVDESETRWHSGYNTTIFSPDDWKGEFDYDWNNGVIEAINGDMPSGGNLKSVKSLEIIVQSCTIPVNIESAMLTYDGRNVDFAKLPDGIEHTSSKDHEIYNNNGSDNADWRDAYFLFGNLYCADPRQNLNKDDWSDPEFAEGTKETFEEDFKRLSLLKPTGGTMVDPLLDENANAFELDLDRSKAIDDRNPLKAAESLDKDKETVEHPGWTESSHLSTAYIRAGQGKDSEGNDISNSGMMSPAELGFIHRGAKWETINISNAAGLSSSGVVSTVVFSPKDLVTVNIDSENGTSYEGGDGAILDQIKMTDKTSSPGKFDITLFDDNDDNSSGQVAYRLLTEYLPLRNDYSSSSVVLNDIGKGGTELGVDIAKTIAENLNNDEMVNGEARVGGEESGSAGGILKNYRSRSQILFNKESEKGFYNAWGALGEDRINNKAAMGELPGKTVNLLKVGSIPDEYRIMVVTQAIQDVGGANNGDQIPLTLKASNGTEVAINAELGKFDVAQSGSEWIYADRILGEVKEVVVFGYDSATKRFYIKERIAIY